MNEIASGTFDELMQFLNSIGWFDIFGDQKEKYIEAIKNWYPNYQAGYFPQDPSSILYAFPNSFDPETIYSEGDYIDLLRLLTNYSYGLFEISNPFEKWEDTADDTILIMLSFSINGTMVEKTWESYGGDLVDREFFDLLAEGLKTCHPPLDQIATTGGNDCVYVVNDAGVIQRLKAYFLEEKEFYWIRK